MTRPMLRPLRLPSAVLRRLHLRRARAALLAFALLAGPWPAALAQPQPALRVQVFVDQQRFETTRREVRYDAVGYRLQPSPAGLRLEPAVDDLLRGWKGDAIATRVSLAPRRFVPVMLVLDLANESQNPLQVVGAHLRVASSATDLQPFIVAADGHRRSVQLRNHGWGPAEAASLRFGFGAKTPPDRPFLRELGTLGAVDLGVQKELETAVPGLPRLIEMPPTCPTEDDLPKCFERLKTTPAGRGLGEVGLLRWQSVLARMHGTLRYRWRDTAGVESAREQTLALDLHLFDFFIEHGQEEKAGMARPPEERGFSPIELPLDRKAYRLPLPYRALIPAGQARRFELALLAPKSSHHAFEIVVETAGGGEAVSPTIELDYLRPNPDTGETRTLR